MQSSVTFLASVRVRDIQREKHGHTNGTSLDEIAYVAPRRKKGSSNVEAVRPGRFLTTVNITQVWLHAASGDVPTRVLCVLELR